MWFDLMFCASLFSLLLLSQITMPSKRKTSQAKAGQTISKRKKSTPSSAKDYGHDSASIGVTFFLAAISGACHSLPCFRRRDARLLVLGFYNTTSSYAAAWGTMAWRRGDQGMAFLGHRTDEFGVHLYDTTSSYADIRWPWRRCDQGIAFA